MEPRESLKTEGKQRDRTSRQIQAGIGHSYPAHRGGYLQSRSTCQISLLLRRRMRGRPPWSVQSVMATSSSTWCCRGSGWCQWTLWSRLRGVSSALALLRQSAMLDGGEGSSKQVDRAGVQVYMYCEWRLHVDTRVHARSMRTMLG